MSDTLKKNEGYDEKKEKIRPRDLGALKTFAKGNLITKLSALIFGLGNILNGQITRGLIYLGLEIAYFYFMFTNGITSIVNLKTLGIREQEEVFNDATQLYEYIPGDNSMLFLLYGVVTIFITFGLIALMISSVRSAYSAQYKVAQGKKLNTFYEDLQSLKEENLHKSLLFLPITGLLCFTIIPIVYMILIAFTNFDREHQPPGNLFDWVGLDNFEAMFERGGALANTFGPVLQWTIVWAVLATVSCFVFGVILAMIINRKETRFKGFWRFTFVLSIAVPQFVSLLTMRTIFNTNGAVNNILRDLNLITEPIQFLTDPTLAKITILMVNLWIGIPFTLLSTTGILQNIPKDLYEAARVDGANKIIIFFKITMPYILFVMTPQLITAFVGNINNFNVIFLLTGGAPESLDYYYAGKTDLLVTWLYKLTIVNKDYNLGAVIGIIIFVIMATMSLLTYRHTGSYKNEEGFQ